MKAFHRSFDNFEIMARKVRDCHGGGLIEFVRKGVICQKITPLELNNLKRVFSKLTISNKRWICFTIYRPRNSQSIDYFFDMLPNSLNRVNELHENFIFLEDFNIDTDI